jgi:hypothetical protein
MLARHYTDFSPEKLSEAYKKQISRYSPRFVKAGFEAVGDAFSDNFV